ATARWCEKPQLDKGFQGNDNARGIFQHNARLVACVVNADACCCRGRLRVCHSRNILCFARKVGRFATKIGRLASQRHKWHLERASGNALQAWTKGPYETRPTLSSGLLSQKSPALSQRLAVIVTKVGRQEQQKPCLAPILASKTFCARLRFRGHALWQTVRPTAKVSGNALAPCW